MERDDRLEDWVDYWIDMTLRRLCTEDDMLIVTLHADLKETMENENMQTKDGE